MVGNNLAIGEKNASEVLLALRTISVSLDDKNLVTWGRI